MRTLLVVAFMAHTTLLCGLAGCTLVTIEGNNNTISDTGGHGGMVLAPQPRPQGVTFPLQQEH